VLLRLIEPVLPHHDRSAHVVAPAVLVVLLHRAPSERPR
jgi:hypothetical protein